MTKRQREQAKRDKKAEKAERRLQRKNDPDYVAPEDMTPLDGPLPPEDDFVPTP